MNRWWLVVAAMLSGCVGVGPGSDGGTGGGSGGGGEPQAGLDLNDVSFLFPLPATVGASNELLALSANSGTGALMPERFNAVLPELQQDVSHDDQYRELRVVSARVDPCFPGSTPPAAPVCVKQLRLVAQPLIAVDGGVGTTTRDATVHLFYRLSDAQFDEVTATLWSLHELAAGRTDARPLDVHPVMRSEGLSGAYATRVKTLITSHCGEQNLTRVAFMSVSNFGTAWRFGAYDVEGGQLVAAKIPRLGDHTAQGAQEFGSETFRNGQLLPDVPNDNLDVLLSESTMRLTDDRTLHKALTATLIIENPQLSSPKTIDCASCHVASRARHNAELRRNVDSSSKPEFYKAPARFNVTRIDAAGDNPKALRSFGYFDTGSALSQRTINESAAIADALTRSKP